jgi:hypothetical protein
MIDFPVLIVILGEIFFQSLPPAEEKDVKDLEDM